MNSTFISLRRTFFIFILILAPQFALAFGVSPALVEALNLPQNTTIQKEFFISRGDPSTAMRGKVVVSGPGAPYISLIKDVVEMPQGQKVTPIPFIIKTGSLGSGTYEAKITVTTIVADDAAQSSTGSRVVTGAQISVHFSVTTEAIEDYEVGSPVTRETEEGQSLGFSYTLSNKGNVDARPTKIDISMVDQEDASHIYTDVILGSSVTPVKALSKETVNVLTKIQPSVGRYLVTLVFYNKDAVIFKNTVPVQVFPRGTLAQKGELTAFSTDKPEYKQGESVKFIGSFKNIGQVGLPSSLVIELYKGSDRIDVLKQDSLFVPMNETLPFEKFYSPTDGGSYNAKAYMTYGPLKSNEVAADFKVQQIGIAWVFGLLGLVIAGMAGFAWKFRKRMFFGKGKNNREAHKKNKK